ncbi:MAG: TIGR03960 family B12-binding radical SAM protein, partial [Deltaproteobacteria bacterium]|nr:TIGR03960 family B12-binding radical SAM protein [Deltaproteobacteria bacterium]
MNLAEVLETEILPQVEKASRYLGTELNAVHKDVSRVEVRLALVFPDLYDLGLGNLGLHILYAIVNKLPWAWCERACSPALDMERALRERGLPLFALESKDSLGQLDGIGITLQSELTYTNILNVLDLSGLPLRTRDRSEDHPLTFAGGPAVFNPEPLAPFMDFFVIGDGEEAIVEICEVLRRNKGRPRADKLLALSGLEGVYVPALYPFETLPDGRILPQQGAPRIRKRITRSLDAAPFPTEYLVPFTQQVHDRVSLEVLRGCTQGCRFCQAGMTTRPVRERTIERVDDLMRHTLERTGYADVSLVSLSTCDHSQVQRLVDRVVQTAREERVSVSLPSLRLDSFSVELAHMVAETRRTGITFAPEAASPRLRAVINKWIPDEDLLRMSGGAYALGWDLVKLYFMIGLPTERDDDVEAIADLSIRTWEGGRAVNPRARVNLGVSTFVPKPFTPFQWAAQISLPETKRRQALLGARLGRVRAIKFGRHDPAETFLEGLVSRADRRAADLIECAFRKGARFEAWGEHLRLDLWMEAIEEVGFDVEDAMRERATDERLPWDHIDVLVDKEWLVQDWERAQELKHAPDCRHRKCHKCGVIDVERELCATMLRDHVQGRKLEAQFAKPERPAWEEPPPAQRLWFRYARTGSARFLSHLEAMNAWMRTLRRARTPLSYTQGFHPHPRLAFSAAL